MTEKDNDLLQKLLSTFRVEAEEHLQLMSSGLLELERTSSAEKQMPIVENIFRAAHSLKGAARAVNMADVEDLCQSLESVFAAWKLRELTPSSELFDLQHKAVESLSLLLTSSDIAPSVVPSEIRELGQNLEKALKAPSSAAKEDVSQKRGQQDSAVFRPEPSELAIEEKSSPVETVRIATAKLDA